MKALNLDFFHRLSRREQALVLLVAGSFFVIVNLVILRLIASSFHDLNAQRREKAFEVQTLALYIQDKPRWEERTRWLREKQPPLPNRDVAGVKLEDQIKKLADQQGVVLSNQQILPAASGNFGVKSPDYQSVVVQLDVKADWKNLVRFLATMQRPEDFVAFESTSLRVDPSDPKSMHGQFRIAKWFAPALAAR